MQQLLFETLEISEELKKAIADMGFEEATPVQSQSITPIMEGRDVVAQAPTGTGKTCAFGIPIMEEIDSDAKQVLALILCPTRELVIQTTHELMKLTKYKESVRIVPIYGGQNIDRQIQALKRKPQIIVATPGRLMDHMRRKTIRLKDLQYMVLDEADEMLNMGFREDIDTILETVPEERQTVLFSATMSKEILRITEKYLHDPEKIQITKSEITVPSIEQFYLEVSHENKTDVLARLMDINRFKLTMVFCNTKRKVDELSSEMAARGYAAQGLHGDMKQAQRDRVMRDFKSGRVEMLIATDVAARGIDIENIEAVFNYDIPEDLEYYVHRIGRTGRAKREGVSYSFVSRREMYKLREIMSYTKAKIKYMPIPKVAEITDVRMKQAMKEVTRTIRKVNLDPYARFLEDYLADEIDGDYTILDVAAAFLSKEADIENLEEIVERPRNYNKNKGDNRGKGGRFDRFDRKKSEGDGNRKKKWIPTGNKKRKSKEKY